MRVVHGRPRLFAAVAVGVATSVVLCVLTSWSPMTRVLVGWDVGSGLYLLLAFHLMATSNVHHMRWHAVLADEGQFTMLVLTVAAGVASLAAIFAELGTANGGGREARHLVLATITIVLSWAFIHTIFALHYAHEFYDENAPRGGGMAFPGGDEEPDYWDFVYFSFVIGMTSQVSDVGITSRAIRRTVTAHGVVSFLFNAALLALTVNIAASAI